MSKNRLMAITFVIFFISIYALIGVFLKDAIGRQNPGLASLFVPPWFNFHSIYEDGKVLDFEAGANRDQIIVDIFGRDYEVEPRCWGDLRAGDQKLYGKNDLIAKIKEQTYLCIIKNDISIRLHFVDDRLEKIEVFFNRTEFP